MYTEKMIKKLEGFLKQYDKVILLDRPNLSIDVTRMGSNKKVLFLTEDELQFDCENIFFERLAEVELKEMVNLYHTYEFSDCFKVISADDNSMGGILNLCRNGVLSEKEVFDIIAS